MPRSQTANESRANESHGASAGKRKSRRSSAGKKKSHARPAHTHARMPVPTAEQVGDLAWAGAHAQAIELATAALTTPGLSVASRLDLLDLRSESFIAQGDLDRAKADADAMLKLADRARTAAFKAQARNRQALVRMRKGEFKAAVASATAALKAARQSKQVPLEAMSLFRLAEAQYRENLSEYAIRNATKAAELFQALGDLSGQGRALWALASAHSNLGHAGESDHAASAALGLCRGCGDLYGAGNALNMLIFNEADLAARLKMLNLALANFEAAGYVERQGVVTHNLGLAYLQLGLNGRARRLALRAVGYRRTGGRGSGGNESILLAEAERAMGHLDSARAYITEMAGMAET